MIESLLSYNSTDLLDDDTAIGIFNTAIEWIRASDSRMPIAYGIMETIKNRTQNNHLKALCMEAKAVYHSEKKDYDMCLENLLEGFILEPLENIQINISKAIWKTNNVVLFERLLDHINRYTSQNIFIKHREVILFWTGLLSIVNVQNNKIYNRALDMMENKSFVMFYKGTRVASPCYTEKDSKMIYDIHIQTVKKILENEDHIKHISDFFSENPYVFLDKVGFFLGYTRYDIRVFHELLAKLSCRIFPFLTYTSSHLQNHNPCENRLKRIGFISASLYEHSVGKMFRGVIKNIDRTKYEPYLYIVGDNPTDLDSYSTKIVQSSGKGTFKETIEMWHNIISKDDLDVLIYPDIGLDTTTYYLSFSRLAPVQAMWWGHVDTAATNIDYFISSRYFEDKQEQYTEKLIRHDGLSVIYERFPFYPDPSVTREALGLPSTGTIYMCVQTIFKWTPAFSEVLCGILEGDPEAWVVGINYYGDCFWTEQVMNPIIKRLGHNAALRIKLIPRQKSYWDFMSLCQHATVMLDTFPFSGSTSHLECFGIGKMAITLCGDTLRGSMCTGIYRALGLDTWIPSPIAHTVEEYVAKALYYAHDHIARKRLEKKILERMEKFYCSKKEIDGWNDIFKILTKGNKE